MTKNIATYAYRLIWNEICSSLTHSSRKYSKEEATEDVRLILADEYENNPYDKTEIYDLIKKAKSSAPPSTAMGIDALILSGKGYTAKDIGKAFGKTPNTITALAIFS